MLEINRLLQLKKKFLCIPDERGDVVMLDIVVLDWVAADLVELWEDEMKIVEEGLVKVLGGEVAKFVVVERDEPIEAEDEVEEELVAAKEIAEAVEVRVEDGFK